MLHSRCSYPMTSYQKAVDALKAAVIDSLDNDVSPNLQGEIWRHYQGMKNIAEQLKPSLSFSLDGVDRVMDYNPDENINFTLDTSTFAAADTISLDTSGTDVITFS